jgi:hypothetical protein
VGGTTNGGKTPLTARGDARPGGEFLDVQGPLLRRGAAADLRDAQTVALMWFVCAVMGWVLAAGLLALMLGGEAL